MGYIELKDKTFSYVRKNINYDFRAGNAAQSKVDSSRIYVSHTQGLMSFYFNEKTKQFEEESATNKIPNLTGFYENTDGSLWLSSRTEAQAIKVIPKYIDGKLDLDASEYVIYDEKDGVPKSIIYVWGQ